MTKSPNIANSGAALHKAAVEPLFWSAEALWRWGRQPKIHLPYDVAVQVVLRDVAMAGSGKIAAPASITPPRVPKEAAAHGR